MRPGRLQLQRLGFLLPSVYPFPCAGTGRRCAPVEVNEHVRPLTECNVKVIIIIIIIIIIRDNKQGTCMLIDVAIIGYRNVIKKGAEKFL